MLGRNWRSVVEGGDNDIAARFMSGISFTEEKVQCRGGQRRKEWIMWR
jgi:hypothetical protein